MSTKNMVGKVCLCVHCQLSLRNMLTAFRKVSFCIFSFCEVIFDLFNDNT